ncbi:MAG: sodium-translocating pyrophosphatase [Candidatus Faecousia sp.]|nr:sodium-translocating pyrophosphatase [Candidatus Faecousia sp.]
MNSFIVFSALGSLLALVFAVLMGKRALSADEGTDQMRKIASFIRDGANAYLRRQYSVVIAFFGIMFVILCVMAAFGYLTWFVPFAFVTGGFFSGFSGFIGMKIATASNARTANACRTGLNAGLRIAFSAGTVMGFTVVGLGLLDVSVWCILLKYVFKLPLEDITAAMLTFGMGASSMALFARVGGGIFTKAADVGADLVGKVEAGIPEDDARNPAAIADNVGDNVGDVAGMGADLYESYVGSLISACSLGVIAFNHIAAVDRLYAFAVPLLLAAIGVVASILGSLLVRTGESTEQMSLLKALRRGTNTAAILIAVAALPLVWLLLGKDHLGLYAAILAGLISGVLIGRFTEYYTSDTYRPTKHLAESSETGTATLVIDGISLGMKSTILPVVVVGICILISYYISGIGAPADARNAIGLYGIALAAVGMLSTLGITLATDAYGPVADNAGGIAQMSGLESVVRERTDALDSLGNTTAATGKGFAIGSAALTALALIANYVEKVQSIDPNTALDMSIMNPVVLVGVFIGACLPYVFASITMGAIGRAAHSVVLEVRRQFREIPGIMEGTADAEFARCVDICTKSSLKEMVAPTLIAIVVPVVTGVVLGPCGVIGMLCGATASGFLLAVFMSNSGGSWDNAKKYIEVGHCGGKGSDNDKAAIVGDTIGDPFKDTSGPSINILIKLLSMVSIVFAALVVNFHLFG